MATSARASAGRIKREGHEGCEVRCHELSRAVAHQLTANGTKVEVVRAARSSCDLPPIASRRQTDKALLDVYAPGRVPQVQLLHDHHVVTRGYEHGPARLDVRHDVVNALCRRMEPESNMPPERMDEVSVSDLTNMEQRHINTAVTAQPASIK